MTEWTNLDERILLDGLWGLLPKMQILGLEMAARHVCFLEATRSFSPFSSMHIFRLCFFLFFPCCYEPGKYC